MDCGINIFNNIYKINNYTLNNRQINNLLNLKKFLNFIKE